MVLATWARWLWRAFLFGFQGFVLALIVAGCVPAGIAGVDASSAAGFESRVLSAGPFRLQSYLRLRESAETLIVYIEGDGRAWLDRETLTSDPTPADSLVLALAAADPAPRVAYLGRPCQYLPEGPDTECPPKYWSSHRYGEDAIAATDAALDLLKGAAGTRDLFLIGYSGGAAVAMLVAARRDDVVGLITLAGVLDHRAWTNHHGVTPLSGSLNPANYAGLMGTIPQFHLVGGDDPIVPLAIVESFVDLLPEDAPVDVIVLPGIDHDCCWAEAWPDLLARFRSGREPG